MTLYIGDLEIREESIGRTVHQGREGWTFEPLWSPGDGNKKLKEVLEHLMSYAREERSRDISELLDIRNRT